MGFEPIPRLSHTDSDCTVTFHEKAIEETIDSGQTIQTWNLEEKKKPISFGITRELNVSE